MAITGITMPADYSDGETLTAAKLNALKNAVSNGSILVTDLANAYCVFQIQVQTDSLASGATHTTRVMVPTGQTWVPVQAEVSYQTGATPTVSLQFTDDGTNVLTTAASAASAGGTPTVRTAFDVSSIAAGSLLVFTLTGSGGVTATNVTGVVHFKCKLQA